MSVRSGFIMLAAASLLVSCGGPKAPEVKTYQVGQAAAAGNLVYNVTGLSWQEQLGPENARRTPQHRFLIINLRVTNSGGTDSNIPLLTLRDPAGNEYPEDQNGDGLEKWLGIPRTVKPAETEHGQVLFDVTPGDYKLRVANDAEGEDERVALVALPMVLAPAMGSAPRR